MLGGIAYNSSFPVLVHLGCVIKIKSHFYFIAIVNFGGYKYINTKKSVFNLSGPPLPT